VHGVLVELTGIIIEVILLLIMVPVVLYVVRKLQTRRVRATVDFYLFQIFHKITGMLLDMASIKETDPILMGDPKKSRKPKEYNHRLLGRRLYGNLENKLLTLNEILAEKDKFDKEVEKRTLDDFEKYARICEKCMDEIDRLIMIFIRLSSVQKELLKTRAAIYPLRDATYQIIEEIRELHKKSPGSSIDAYWFQRLAKMVIKFIDITFQKRKKLIDSVMKHEYYSKFFRRWVLPLPYVLARRRISLWICRLKKKRYRDPHLYPYVSDMLVEWRTKNGFNIKQAAKILGMPEKEYRDYEYGYREPNMERFEMLRKHLQGKVDYSQPEIGTESMAGNSS
jgi:hypothetical protein